MKRLATSLIFLTISALNATAQDSIAAPRLTHEILEEARRDSSAMRAIQLPLATGYASRLDMMPACGFYSPWAFYGPASWSLHEGFNAEVGFSVSGSFGKGRTKGAGFGEHFAAAYAMPFGKDKRWIGAVGLYADRLDWGTYHRTEAGIAGILGYNVNDWCNLYLYGAYNFVPTTLQGSNPYAMRYGYGRMPWDFYDNLRGRIGAAAEFKIGESAAITVSFEHEFFSPDRPILPSVPPPPPGNGNKNSRALMHPESATPGSNRR